MALPIFIMAELGALALAAEGYDPKRVVFMLIGTAVGIAMCKVIPRVLGRPL